jgi:3-hydroxy-9,10-secoandrosta-1,3,5(10)-triene-9,17-dione monooxygenase
MAIAPPNPPADATELIDRARALIPRLRERAADCEARRAMPPETLADLLDAGLFRVLQPRRFGGYEMPIGVLLKVAMEISRGCGSSGWVYSLTAGHSWWAAMYPEAGQTELYGQDGDIRFPLIFAPQGQAVPVDGGFRVSGRWGYASGLAVSNWLGINAVVGPKEKGQPPADLRLCIIPADQCDINDNWHVMGLRGTGSVQAIIDDLFVPEQRALSLMALDRAPPPGAHLHDNPLFHAPAGPIFYGEIAAVAVGIARGAVDAFTDRALNKPIPFRPGLTLYETGPAQRRLAQATAKVDIAEAAVLGAADAYTGLIESELGQGRRIALADRTKLQVAMIGAVGIAAEAVDMLFIAGGTSAMNDGEPLQRAFRDINAVRTHYLFDMERVSENFGRMLFHMEPLNRTPGI